MKAFSRLLPVALVVWAFAAGVSNGPGAQDAPAPAHVRLWMADPHGSGSLRVSFKLDGHHATVRELGSGMPGYQFGNYVDVPSGHGAFETFSDQEKRTLGNLPADLASDAFVTLLLVDSEKTGEPPRLILVEDADSTTDSAQAQITVRNFVGDLKDMRVDLGDSLNAQFVSGTGFLVMRGVKAAVYQVHTTGTTSDGKPFEWTNEADLRQNHRQTLLVYPDPYGRIRPRMSVDGGSASNQSQDSDKQQ